MDRRKTSNRGECRESSSKFIIRHRNHNDDSHRAADKQRKASQNQPQTYKRNIFRRVHGSEHLRRFTLSYRICCIVEPDILINNLILFFLSRSSFKVEFLLIATCDSYSQQSHSQRSSFPNTGGPRASIPSLKHCKAISYKCSAHKLKISLFSQGIFLIRRIHQSQFAGPCLTFFPKQRLEPVEYFVNYRKHPACVISNDREALKPDENLLFNDQQENKTEYPTSW